MMENKTEILRMSNISKRFGGTHALKDVDFSLLKGEIHGLVGENGAGKSTLIKIIAGYYQKDSGDILLNGERVDILNPKRSLELGIRVISQEFNLMEDMTVAENMALGNYPLHGKFILDRKTMEEKAQNILDRIGADINSTEKIVNQSVANKQMIEIAKSLWEMPKILIMDEPTAALNDQETTKLFDVIKDLKKLGVTTVFITHRLQEQYDLADRITVLRNGNYIDTFDPRKTDTDKLIEAMVGKDIGANYHRKKRFQTNDCLFEMKNVSIPGKLDNINLHINRGEIVSVFGLLGQGQETLGRVLLADIPYASGEIVYQKKEVRFNSPVDVRKAQIGYVSDDRKSTGIFPIQSVKNNIIISSLMRVSTYGVINTKKENNITNDWSEVLSIKYRNILQNISTLSGGNQQKAMIARWLANESKFLILNLPTRGVDIGAKYEIYTLLEDLCEEGVGVLVISLELPEVLGISDRIYVIRDGSIAGEMNAEEANDISLMNLAIGQLT